MRPSIRREIRRRAGIERVIGHMKADGHLGRNVLAGAAGDAIHLVLAVAGHASASSAPAHSPQQPRAWHIDAAQGPSTASVSNLCRINRNPLIRRALGTGKAAMVPGANAASSKNSIVPDAF
jgi:hypothetical protein